MKLVKNVNKNVNNPQRLFKWFVKISRKWNSDFMMKRLVIKIFKLDDISDMIYKSKRRQKELDDKFWKEKLQDGLDHLKREQLLELQEKDAQISMLNEQVNEYKKRERDLDKKEYFIKKQSKENSHMATKLNSKIEDFGISIMKIAGEMKGIRAEAEEHKLKIESR